jgi:hypothetical protein
MRGDLAERALQPFLKQGAIGEARQRIVVGYVMHSGLGTLAFRDLHLQLLIGLNKLGRARSNPLFQVFVHLTKGLARAAGHIFRPFQPKLRICPGKRHDEIDRLRHIVVGADREGFRNVFAL